MKIVHLVTALDFGGLERRMEILSHYPSKTNELVFCSLSKGGATYQKMLANDSNVHLLNCDPKIFRINTYLTLRKFLKSEKPTVIHTHGAEANFYGQLAGFELGIKIRVAEEIGIPSSSKKAQFVFSKIFKLSHSVIAMSPIVKNFLIDKKFVQSHKVDLVYNPVLVSDLKKTHQNKTKIKFIFIGRLESVKNPIGLLRAFKALLTNHTAVELIYVGDGTLRNELEKLIDSENIGDFVKCLGFVSDPLSIARECDVVVQPSHTEGFSLALVEAMSCGLPAVATPVGSAKELIVDNISGWVVNSSKDSDILIGLERAVKAKDQLFEMGRIAADKVYDNHSPNLYAEKLDNFYLSLGA